MICHASGDWNKPIIPGFYLYYIAQQDKSVKEFTEPLNDLRAFENEWMEIEMQSCDYLWFNGDSNAIEVFPPNFLKDEPMSQFWSEHRKNGKYLFSFFGIIKQLYQNFEKKLIKLRKGDEIII